MGIELQILMIAFAICFLVVVITFSKKNKLNIKYAILWIMGAIGVLILSIFPKLLDTISVLFRISTPVTTLFFITISILYAFVFYIFMKLSYMERRINNLTYENAVLRKKLEENER